MSAGENVILHVMLASSVYFSLSILRMTLVTFELFLGIAREKYESKVARSDSVKICFSFK